MAILYRSDAPRADAWKSYFANHAPDFDFRLWPDAGNLDEIEYLIAWQVPRDFLQTLPRLKVLFSSGAGIDHVDMSAIPPHIPLVRMVEPGIIDGMVEYVSLSVLALHRDFFDYVRAQETHSWDPLEVPPASARRIGIMGLGVLGCAVLKRLATYGFRLRGWNRSPREIDGVETFAGQAELSAFLSGCDMLVCLLPLTPQTRGILNRDIYSKLPAGASIINAARGAHLINQDLIDALDSGHLSRAILDVADPEPLPPRHPLWMHPKIFITPHVASMTQPDTAAPILLENIRRHQRGEPLLEVIDRSRGY